MTGERPAARWRRVGLPLLMMAASVGVTLVVLEIVLRIAGFSTTPVDIRIGEQNDPRRYHVFEDHNFEYHPDLIWSPKPSQSIFNSQGFRGPELAPQKAPGTLRVFAVGDSNTLGWSGPNGANWPAAVGRLIAGVRQGADVVNAGVWGYASFQGLRRFRQVLTFSPDIVLVSFGSNDALWVARSDADYDAGSLRQGEWGRALQRFALGDLALFTVDLLKRRPTVAGPRVTLADYRANLSAMIDEGRARGVEVVLLTRPYVGPVDRPLWWKNRAADYNEATAEVATQRGVMLVDVYSFFKDRDDLFADESHFTDEGHRLAAATIFDHIRPLVTAR